MTNKRRKTNDESSRDTAISELYREVAKEHTPEHLDARILDEAARRADRRYAAMTPWVRPFAWAATVGLTLAIVLEVTRLPPPETDPTLLPTQLTAPSSQGAAEQDVIQVGSEHARDSETNEVAIATSEPAGARAGAETFEATQMQSLDQARDIARTRLRANQPGGPDMNDTLSVAPQRADREGCTEHDRRAPESWLACIENLEREGVLELAKTEREQLRAAFPEFARE